jgi:hypothetical protein
VSLQRELRALQSELTSAKASWREEREAAEMKLQRALGASWVPKGCLSTLTHDDEVPRLGRIFLGMLHSLWRKSDDVM